MYAIYHADKPNKRAVYKTFKNYEVARTFARKMIRKTANYKMWSAPYHNPDIGFFGFTIRKVA